MKFYNRIEWQMVDDGLEFVSADPFEYSGPVAECKGDGVARDQLNRENALVDKALAEQRRIQGLIESGVGKYLTSDIGFSPEQLAAMRSQFLNENDSAFNAAGSNVRSALASRGAGTGEIPIGGDYARNIAELEGMAGASQSQGLLGIKLQDALQSQNNRWNAASVMGGNSAQLGGNIGTFNSGASNALNQYVYAANQGFGNAFTSALGGGLGKGLATGITGGISGFIPKQYGGARGG